MSQEQHSSIHRGKSHVTFDINYTSGLQVCRVGIALFNNITTRARTIIHDNSFRVIHQRLVVKDCQQQHENALEPRHLKLPTARQLAEHLDLRFRKLAVTWKTDK